MRPRVLRRPIGGWGARKWRQDVIAWLALAWLVVTSWATLNLAVELLRLLGG